MFDGDPDFHRLTFVLCCLQWPGLDLGKGRKLNSQHFVIDTALDVLAAQKPFCQKSFHQKRTKKLAESFLARPGNGEKEENEE